MPLPGYYRFSVFHRPAWQVSRLVPAFFRDLRDSSGRFLRSAKEEFSGRGNSGRKARPMLTLLLVGAPFGVLVLFGSPSWFLNWPVMFAGAVLLTVALKGPLAWGPLFLRKIVKIAIAACLLQGLVMFLDWKPFMTAFRLTRKETFWPVLAAIVVWFFSVLWILFSRPRLAALGGGHSHPVARLVGSGGGRLRFSDLGGMEEAKEQIRHLVRSQLEPAKYRRYGVVRNGILLHGPRGSGKTFLAEATAGEFGLNYYYLSPTQLITTWLGETESRLRDAFSAAAAQQPVVFFIDELVWVLHGKHQVDVEIRAEEGGRITA